MNRLQHETSPYLKQHESNPVDWFPWGEEALAKSKKEDKPILLSVGYSACHWCHVMAHESFENPNIAKIMNENFVNIKVDREERPDLDHIYQPVAQMITQGGGWPLTVFLTPDLQPFYGGTYFPPVDSHGRAGFPRLLVALARSFRDQRNEIVERAQKMTEILQMSDDFSGDEYTADGKIKEGSPKFNLRDARELLAKSLEKLLSMVDWKNGGMGGAPKFPNPMVLTYLWRMSQMEWINEQLRVSAREAVHLSLQKMACGGIFDQIGGGFHRYSVDAEWAVPHFEKMLYDNGLLLKLYSEVLLNDKNDLYLDVIQKTVLYVEREMTSPQGLFYAAQDADSEGEEGKFFVWDREELATILNPDELELFCSSYGVTTGGNFEHGKTVLARQDSSLDSRLETAVEKVFHARSKRIRPGLDSKTLVSWNGLMISGLAWSSLALEKQGKEFLSKKARALAQKAYSQIQDIASQTDGGLSSTIQEGKPRFDGYLDDYAFLAQGALDLGRVIPDNRENYFKDIQQWLKRLQGDFKDPTGLGYYFTHSHQSDLIHRPKTFFDQAIPSGNAVAFQLLNVVGDNQFAEAELAILMRSILENPYGLGELLNAILLRVVDPVLIQGESSEARGNPFCFFEKKLGPKNSTQFCHQQQCVLEKFDFSKIFQ